jgi:metal-responsive CopG/Arc/MetJ family transcriptional regulator
MQKKLTTSIKLQKTLHHRLQQRIIEDGYGMRGKSKWIIEAIESFLHLADYPTLVEIAEDMDHLNEMVSIRLTEDLMKKMDQAILRIRQQFPTLEGVRSNLIRASIMQRLLRQPTSVAEV